MVQRFSMIFERTNQNVSGVAYWPLSPFLRSADATLTKPLTLPCQKGFRATESKKQVILFIDQKTPGYLLEQRMPA